MTLLCNLALWFRIIENRQDLPRQSYSAQYKSHPKSSPKPRVHFPRLLPKQAFPFCDFSLKKNHKRFIFSFKCYIRRPACTLTDYSPQVLNANKHKPVTISQQLKLSVFFAPYFFDRKGETWPDSWGP